MRHELCIHVLILHERFRLAIRAGDLILRSTSFKVREGIKVVDTAECLWLWTLGPQTSHTAGYVKRAMAARPTNTEFIAIEATPRGVLSSRLRPL